MNKTFLSVYIIAATTVIYGCATHKVNLSENGRVAIDRVPSNKFYIPYADAYEDGNDLLITGVVKRRSVSTGLLRAHVDVTIFSAEGTILQQGHTKAIYMPGRRAGWERFRLRFQGIPPQGAKIKMVVEPGEHIEGGL